MPLKVVDGTEDSVKHALDITALVFHNNKLYSASDDGKIKVRRSFGFNLIYIF